jgi:hypothetical protein
MLVADTHRAALMEKQQRRKPTVKEVALITRETRPAALKEIWVKAFEFIQMGQMLVHVSVINRARSPASLS